MLTTSIFKKSLFVGIVCLISSTSYAEVSIKKVYETRSSTKIVILDDGATLEVAGGSKQYFKQVYDMCTALNESLESHNKDKELLSRVNLNHKDPDYVKYVDSLRENVSLTAQTIELIRSSINTDYISFRVTLLTPAENYIIKSETWPVENFLPDMNLETDKEVRFKTSLEVDEICQKMKPFKSSFLNLIGL